MEENIDKCLDEQRILICEREQLIGVIEKGNDELKQLETELMEFYKLHPNYYDNNSRSSVMLAWSDCLQYLLSSFFSIILKDLTDFGKFEKTALKITDREQKLLAEMAHLNLLDDPKLTVNITLHCIHIS